MFDLSLEKILVLVMVALFVLGPERLPAAAQWLGKTVRQVKDYAAAANDQLRTELGPEMEQFRQPLEELQALRGLDPRRAVRRHLLPDPPLAWTDPPTPPLPDPAAVGRAHPGSPGAPAAAPSDQAAALRVGELAPVDLDAT